MDEINGQDYELNTRVNKLNREILYTSIYKEWDGQQDPQNRDKRNSLNNSRKN